MSLLNLLQYCFCYMLCFFGCKAYELLAPGPGTESIPPALEGEVLTMDHQGSPIPHFKEERGREHLSLIL